MAAAKTTRPKKVNEGVKDDLVVLEKKANDDSDTLELSYPIMDGDKEITHLTFVFENLTVDHLLMAENKLPELVGQAEAALTLLKANSTAYQILIASYATNVPYTVLKKLNAKDALKVGMRVQGFLMF